MPDLRFEGTALCFDSEEDALRGSRGPGLQDGDVIVIRYEGPKGGPGMREMLSTTGALYGQGMGGRGGADHRWPLLRGDAGDSALGMSGRKPPLAVRSALLKNGDRIVMDAVRRDDRRAAIRRGGTCRAPRRMDATERQYNDGAIWKYTPQLVSQAHLGAVTNPGGAAETHCYADI